MFFVGEERYRCFAGSATPCTRVLRGLTFLSGVLTVFVTLWQH